MASLWSQVPWSTGLLCAYPSFCPQPEERSQFEILKAQMFAERLAKRNRRTKRARAMPEEEPAAGPGKRFVHPVICTMAGVSGDMMVAKLWEKWDLLVYMAFHWLWNPHLELPGT